MDHKVEGELILQLKKGNIHAFNKVYEEYHQALYRNIFKITRDSEVSEDILQDVFTTLWEHRCDLERQKSLGGWLFVISFNKSINYTKKKLMDLKAKDNLSFFYSKRAGIEDNVDHYEAQYGLVKNAIAQLSPQKQRIFVLCKIEGKTYEEAANALNISRYTVKEYLSSAMAFVRDYTKRHSDSLNIIGLISFFVLLNIC